jgi:hypothetical protein
LDKSSEHKFIVEPLSIKQFGVQHRYSKGIQVHFKYCIDCHWNLKIPWNNQEYIIQINNWAYCYVITLPTFKLEMMELTSSVPNK